MHYVDNTDMTPVKHSTVQHFYCTVKTTRSFSPGRLFCEEGPLKAMHHHAIMT